MAAPSPPLRAALERALGLALGQPDVRVSNLHPLGGGCVSPAAQVESSAGCFFAKWSASGPAEQFEREAFGLRTLARAESGLVIPRVLWASAPTDDAPALLLTEYLAPRAPRAGDDEALGRGLAALHATTATRFGFDVASYCGTTRQDNAWGESWADFYARQRLAPLVVACARQRGLGDAERRVLERVLARVPALLATGARPALIHGDLWSGNVLWSASGPGLCDPACAYADREMEFGLVTLFGGFGERFWRAYDEALPLPAGWRERNALYQLYHLLNHQLLFGGGYGAQAVAVARRYA